jgi:DNA-binding NarL/FixJ family response regulator
MPIPGEIGTGFHDPHGADFEPAPRVYIVGSDMPQNRLLCSYLTSSLQAECSCHTEFPAPGSVPAAKSLKVVLFNVDTDCRLERLVRAYKIKGIFYREDSRSIFLKGMRAILKGELWLRRKMLARCVLMSDAACTPAWGTSCNNLSQREKEILLLVAEGHSNQEIADLLRISVHTVKTHLYNIYRKVAVPNRLQATLWAKTHLQGMWNQSEGSHQVSGHPSV